jgi:Spy/CpxP family protein refolding chaperone
MTPRVKGALLLLLAFVLGATAGALGFGWYQARTGWWGPRRDPVRFQQVVLRRLTRELELRSEQQQRVEAILRESGEEFARLRQEIRPRFQAIRERSRDRIREILDPEQRARFEVLAEQWDRRVTGRWDRSPGGTDREKAKAP